MKREREHKRCNFLKVILCFLMIPCALHAFPIPNKKISSQATSVKMFRKNDLDKGFNILENASKIVPQGSIVSTAKTGWKFAWKVNFVLRNSNFM